MNARRLARNIFIFVLWSWLFLYWLRFFLLKNWFFDFVWANDWAYVWHEWITGWVISSVSDWTFIFTLFTAIPLWLIGYLLMISVNWTQSTKIIIAKTPLWKKKEEQKKERKPVFAKAPSHKKKRPPALNIGEIQQRVLKQEDEEKTSEKSSEQKAVLSSQDAKEEKEPASYEEFLSSIKKPSFEEKNKGTKKDSFFDDDFDPNISETGLLPDITKNGSGHPVFETKGVSLPDTGKALKAAMPDLTSVLKEKGYRVLTDVLIDGARIDCVGLSNQKIVLCQIDKEPGDWLADEEQFNNEIGRAHV